MICPVCGKEIPEGHMYCDECGKEINFVPDFDPEVENEINATLSGVADELNKEAKLKALRIQKRKEFFSALKKKSTTILLFSATIIIIVIVVTLLLAFHNKTPLYYLSIAESSRNSGDLDKAIEYLVEGNKDNPESTEIIFRLSDYYLEAGDPDKAAETLCLITNSDRFSDEKVTNAYEGIISIYKENGDYDKIVELLSNDENEIAKGLKEKYIPPTPVMSPEGDTYEDSITVTVSKGAPDDEVKVYYTVNGDNPDNSGIPYEKEIVLDAEGEYKIKAVSVNKYGFLSAVAENTYTIEAGTPDEPIIMEASGEYSQNTMIVAVTEPGTSIFYTTDGSDPTMDSKQYISPISMPVGTSHFKFIAYNNEGLCSEIVERDYHLVFARLVTKEQAVNSVVSTLVRLNYLLDETGKEIGVPGHNEYVYRSEIEVEGAGEYYVIDEIRVGNDGSRNPSGRIYAVNTHDGTVNRLGYDSGGKYILITISNR
ncbi:chitobiase/beta-hexosaminidase C-terminal domain-containing protein [Butyrivibrio sp. INlla21]|uniref:chitobiase/beta-hexosaminidase C-terminal domain-containing protein n=1 Tax=Butyrivibrio sp. INlla21 TaxID=1520811 RepID=UPI0008E542C7|nr:chitobiase/beta-hexosaminidase C-terminal domain-containing protein [Butyrivibrio sp. INlla21]SFU47931.1 Tetratricopeptide repeat-containing protein [Butyrivibrio sp. INlla21]